MNKEVRYIDYLLGGTLLNESDDKKTFISMLNKWQQEKNSYENIGVDDSFRLTGDTLTWTSDGVKRKFVVKNGKIVKERSLDEEVIDESWLDDELSFYTELVKKNPKITELQQKLKDVQKKMGLIKEVAEEDIVVNEDTDRELMAELEKFKKKLKEKVPAHHWAHVKVWSSFNDLYNTIHKVSK